MKRAHSVRLACLIAGAVLAGCEDGDSLFGGGGGGGGGGDAGPSTFLSAMPPGSNGNAAGGIGGPAGIPPEETVYPAHYEDQLHLYGNLSYAQSPLVIPESGCQPPADIDEHEQSSDDACNYWKRADIELPDDQAVSALELEAPNGKLVTIRRDGWGVPYIDAEDRESAEYGLGYAAAQDRLWLFDLLRHVGRGRASEFLGAADDLYSQDNEFGVPAGYSEDELTAIVDSAVAKIGEPLGPKFLLDVQRFVEGMNAYVASLQGPGASDIPPEYASLAAGAIPPRFPPRDFTVNDIVANAVLIQSALGLGGGGEARNVALLQALDATIGPGTTTLPQTVCEIWRDLRHANATDTTYSASGTFSTQSGVVTDVCPQPLPDGVVFWDKGSYVSRPLHVRTESLPPIVAAPASGPQPMLAELRRLLPADERPLELAALRPPLTAAASQSLALERVRDSVESVRTLLAGDGTLQRTASNWIAASGSQTVSGHPILVGGPQTGYFNPQLLWEAAVISRGGTPFEIAARGISTVNLPYLVIGHGLDFAWSPTSAGSDFTDTRVSVLCNTDGSPVTSEDVAGNFDDDDDGYPDADGYLYKGDCVRFYKRVDEWTASPTAASFALGCTGGPDGPGTGPCHELPESVSRNILRTHYGPVVATATVADIPVAISTQRSTFMADVDTAAPFALLTTTGLPMDSLRFRKLFNSMTATFNWLYADENDIAYIQSGLYPRRHPEHAPELPVWGDGNFEWVVDEDLGADGTDFEDFFADFGGDDSADGDDEDDGVASGTVSTFPSRAQPTEVDEQGYYEWPGFLALGDHIQDVNPAAGFMANWNNSGARGWWAADGNGTYGPTHRVEMLRKRLEAFQASGRKHTLATMIEVAADAAYTDHRGLDLLPLLIQVMQTGSLTADQQAVILLLQGWLNEGSQQWIDGGSGLGAFRRDRDADGLYDHRAAVVLMDAWYGHLIDTVTSQMVAWEGQGAPMLTGRLDAPRAQGSAFQEGWYQHMRRMLRMALDPGAQPRYRQLKCAGTGALADCRAAVLTALDEALADLGGLAEQANWTGEELGRSCAEAPCTVENYDAVVHSTFGFLALPQIRWINRPTFHQAVEITRDRSDD